MRTAIFILLAILAFHVSAAHTPSGQLQDQQHYNEYTLRIYLDTNSFGCFEVLRSGKQVYFQDGQFFRVGNANPEPATTNLTIKMGQSITGAKQPNLLVTGWTSGNHCCTTFYVFEIGQKFKLIEKIDAEYFETSEFRDSRGDGNLELVTADWTFAYWNVGCAFSHCPTVILKYREGRYVPDLELMKKPAPSQTEIEDLAKSFKSKFHDPDLLNVWPAPYELWQKMLDLIFTGNEEAAWRLLDLSWADRKGKLQFVKAFKKQLTTSPYYAAINQPTFQR
jgi:hypothetical protein